MPEVRHIGKSMLLNMVLSLFSLFICLKNIGNLSAFRPFMKNETLVGEEDELVMNEDVGSWSDFKYRLVQLYCQLFTAGMKGKWGSLVYVDSARRGTNYSHS
jgi:hypothetical protein